MGGNISQEMSIDDQPISATFFDEGKWITEFITPDALEVENLHDEITQGLDEIEDKAVASWKWVATQVKYVKYVRATLKLNGHVSRQSDYWQMPSQLIRTRIGNCANKTFLLTSLLRRDLSEDSVYAVLGNLNQGVPGGHAWVEMRFGGASYIMESTRGDMKPMVSSAVADIYEPVIYFNDKCISAIEGRTLLEPFTAVYADWLKDYLDWAYIEGRK